MSDHKKNTKNQESWRKLCVTVTGDAIGLLTTIQTNGELQQYESKNETSWRSTWVRYMCKYILWEKKGIPQFLLSAIFFYMGSTLLSAGKEHCQLWSHPCPIEIVEHQCQQPYLRYCDDVTYQNGLEGRNIKPKVAIHHSNESNPERFFVRFLKHYCVPMTLLHTTVTCSHLVPKLTHVGIPGVQWDATPLAQL